MFSNVIFSEKNLEFLKSNVNINIDNNQLAVRDSVNDLGLIIDEDFRFKSHINQIVKKSYYALKLLYSSSGVLDFRLRKKLCETLVLPFLNYGFILYYSCLDVATKYRLQKIQNSCCRFVYGLNKFEHVSAKIKELGWLKIDQLYKYHLSMYTYKILKTSSPRNVRDLFRTRATVNNINSLRSKMNLHMPRFRTSLYQRSVVFNMIKLYNSQPLFHKNLSLTVFRKKIKYLILNSTI